ncbi:MarR family protein [Prauserella shujinwangii]|uniref:MarR family protein n=1 Tax=Prauserella shujinwangii TaxID=1453103 RepID=A0A2T0LN70_9PSEU|nr:MarR family transcriptional regulator [Prauserella shujinwangii]PRX44551.1 MarR family protein [Prauserella shujinwangii]
MTSAHEKDEGFDDTALIRKLRQLTVETDHFAEIFRTAHHLHRTDLNALTVIMDATLGGRSLSPGELAEALHLSASATTALLDRLEAAGHVVRDRSGEDRRRIELRIREPARELGRRFFGPLGTELAREWSGFTPEERQVIRRFLTATIEATVRTRGRLARGEEGHPS